MSSTPPQPVVDQPPSPPIDQQPPPQQHHHPQSSAQLASILAHTLGELERTAKERDSALTRAQHAEQQILSSQSHSDPQNASATIANLQARNDQQQRTINELSARLKRITDAFGYYERWIGTNEVRSADARTAFTRTLAALASGDSIDIHTFNPRDIPPFQPPLSLPKSRRSSRAQRSDSFNQYPPQIPPGAPGGPPTSSSGVPSNLPPVPIHPSGVVAGRVRPRPSSPSLRLPTDDPNGRPDDPEDRQRFSSGEDHDTMDPDSERQRKRLKSDTGPSFSATLARREGMRFTDSPQPAHTTSTLSNPLYHNPHSLASGAHPHTYPPGVPHSPLGISSLGSNAQPLNGSVQLASLTSTSGFKHKGSEPGYSPRIIHAPYQSRNGSGPRSHRDSDSTLVTPSSASTTGQGPASHSFNISSHTREPQRVDSGDSFSSISGGQVVTSPPPMDPSQRRFSVAVTEHLHHPHHASTHSSNHSTHSPSRLDDEALRRRESDRQRQRALLHRDRTGSVNPSDQLKSGSQEVGDSSTTAGRMDVDDLTLKDAIEIDARLDDPNTMDTQLDSQAHPGPGTGRLVGRGGSFLSLKRPPTPRAKRLLPDAKEDSDSVQEFLLGTVQDEDHEQDQLRDDDMLLEDRLLSPKSSALSRVSARTAPPRRSVDADEMERWKERDRLRELDVERKGLQADERRTSSDSVHTGSSPYAQQHSPQQHFSHIADSIGSVKTKDRGDRFRHYTPQQSQPGHPSHLHLAQSNVQPSPHYSKDHPYHHPPIHAHTHPPPNAGSSYPPSAGPLTSTFPLGHRESQPQGGGGPRRGTAGSGSIPPLSIEAGRPPSHEFHGDLPSAPDSAGSFPHPPPSRRHSLSVSETPPAFPPSGNHQTMSSRISGSSSLPGAGGPSTSVIYATQPRHTGPGPAVKPSLNAQGQRTCRQCGQPGRYKDGKCVEKWGPGPAGPGTVCDKCRKKMKRVERRGTQDAAALGQHLPLTSLSTQPHTAMSSQSQSQPQSSPPRASTHSHPYGPTTPGNFSHDTHFTESQSQFAGPRQREYQFQTPLSTASSWGRGGEQWEPSGRNVAPKSTKEKRKAPSFSPSPPASPHPAASDNRDDGETRHRGHLFKREAQAQSIRKDVDSTVAPLTHGSSSSVASRKSSAGETNGMESAAADLMTELVGEAESDNPGQIQKPGVEVKNTPNAPPSDDPDTFPPNGDVEGDGDANLEDALGEDEDEDGNIHADQPGGSATSTTDKVLRPSSSLSTSSQTREKQANSPWVKVEEAISVG